MREKKGTVRGFGINDVDYQIQIKQELPKVDGKRKQKVIWTCPYYARWKHMINRVYSEKELIKFPTYIGCSVSLEWKYLSDYKRWMEKQNWEGCVLDKDILVKGNKEYGPNTCCFVPENLNYILMDSKASRGDLPLGVTKAYNREGFIAAMSRGKEPHYLGYFKSVSGAHKAWQKAKADFIEESVQLWYGSPSYRPDVADALLKRSWQISLDRINDKETIDF